MFVEELPIKKGISELIEKRGISELYPPQVKAIDSGIADGRNILLCTPTASGKTLVAEIAMAKHLEKGKKCVFIVPLRAIAYEKYVLFREYEKLGYRVELQMGDLETKKSEEMPDFDILVTTAEKCDSLLRAKTEDFRDIGMVVIDEIHLIASDRGHVYEIVIAKFRSMFPEIQILGLSATIGNAGEIATWLDAEPVVSEWRPVKLVEECVVGEDIDVIKKISGDSQCIVFVNSRRCAEALAEKLSNFLEIPRDSGRESIEKAALNALSSPTKQCKKLAKCIKGGIAFHHAGLVNKQRILVEEAFKKGKIRVIVATPTLAAGINAPARYAVIRDIKRYTERGMAYIPVLEYKQMIGRAGRPEYDKTGYAVTIVKDENAKEFIEEHYIMGKPEPINSALGAMPTLRFHTLALIASGFTRSEDSIIRFFGSTFFGYQYGVEDKFKDMLTGVIHGLNEWGMIAEKKGILLPTSIGGRISELYIDPKTAHDYMNYLGIFNERKKNSDIGILEFICDASELRPFLSIKSSEESILWTDAYAAKEKLFRDIEAFDLDWEFPARFKTASMFCDWINEMSEEGILEKYDLAPGILYSKLQNLDWMAYSASEIARVLNLGFAHGELVKLRVRIKHGIKEELLPLIALRGIGRVRARKLFGAGYKSAEDIKEADTEKIARLLGKKIAENLKAAFL